MSRVSRLLIVSAVLVASVVTLPNLEAQRRRSPAPSQVEITPYAGYQFGLTSVSSTGGVIDIKDDVSYGGSIGFRIRPGQFIELTWNRIDSELRRRQGGIVTNSVPIAVNNFYLGGFQEFGRDQIRPFFGFNLGATWYDPKNTFSDEWRFSTAIAGGAKIMFGEAQRIGLRLQGSLMGTFFGTGSSLWCGFGGCSVGLFGSGVADLSFTAGLVIGLGESASGARRRR